MFEDKESKKIIIVCDEKTKVYANLLLQQIGCKDNNEAVVWEEKNYIANEATLSSRANIIFIGMSKISHNIIPNIELKYDNYGMRYGWLGNRAVLYVDKEILDNKQYKGFVQYSKDEKKAFNEVNRNIINTTDKRLRFAGLLFPYIWPIALYGLITGTSAEKKIRQQQYNLLVSKFCIKGLDQFLEE